MSVPRAVKFAWKEMLGIAIVAIVLVAAFHQLYRGWAYHVIDEPWSRLRTLTATLPDQPIRFAVSVALFGAVAIVMLALLGLLIVGLRSELQNFRVREARPPLDDAVRQPFDER